MGEYGIRRKDGKHVKIGSCEEMFNLRYEDRFEILKVKNSLDPKTCKNLFWRLPIPAEDGTLPGEYDIKFDLAPFVHLPGYVPEDAAEMRAASERYHKPHCCHGSTAEYALAYSEDKLFFNLIGIKNDDTKGMRALIRCRHCGELWTCDIIEVAEFIEDPELKRRMLAYLEQDETAKNYQDFTKFINLLQADQILNVPGVMDALLKHFNHPSI